MFIELGDEVNKKKRYISNLFVHKVNTRIWNLCDCGQSLSWCVDVHRAPESKRGKEGWGGAIASCYILYSIVWTRTRAELRRGRAVRDPAGPAQTLQHLSIIHSTHQERMRVKQTDKLVQNREYGPKNAQQCFASPFFFLFKLPLQNFSSFLNKNMKFTWI